MPDTEPRHGKGVLALILGLIFVAAVAAAPLYLPATTTDADNLHAQLQPAIQKLAAQLEAVSANLAAISDLRQQLEAEDVPLTADALARLAEARTEPLDDVESHLQQTARALEAVQRRHPDVGAGRAMSANLGGPAQLPQLARSTFQEFQRLLTEAESRLRAAEQEARALVGRTVGEASARSSTAANQLAALVVSQQGLIAANRAALLRSQAAHDRAAAAMLSSIVVQVRRIETSIAARVPTAAAEAVKQRIAASEAALAAGQRAIDELEKIIKQRSDEADALRQSARDARRQLAEIDAELTDLARKPTAARFFAEKRRNYERLSDQARQAEARADALEFGSLAGATLADPADGDLLAGPYEDGRVEPGLVHLRARSDGAREDLEALAASLEAARLELERVESTAADLRVQRDEIAAAARQCAESIDALLARAARRSGAAREAEDQALQFLAAAARHAAVAVSAAQKRVSDARSIISEVNPDPPNERLNDIVNDKDTEAAARFLSAEIAAAGAEILYQRLTDLLAADLAAAQRARLLGEPPPPPANESAVAEDRKTAVERLDKAITELTAADNLVKTASYTIGTARIQGANYRWQFQVAQAAAHLLLSQLAETPEALNDQRDKAYQLLTEAAQGREGSPLLASAVDMILYLQKSSQ